MLSVTAPFPSTPSEVFGAIKDALGVTYLTREAKMTKQTIYRWCASTSTNETTRKNPLHILENIIEELMIRGNDDIAIAIVDRLAAKVGGELSFRNATPDKRCFLAETLDVNAATNRFHALAQDRLEGGTPSRAEVRAAKKYAHQQIDEAFTAFEKEIDNK